MEKKAPSKRHPGERVRTSNSWLLGAGSNSTMRESLFERKSQSGRPGKQEKLERSFQPTCQGAEAKQTSLENLNSPAPQSAMTLMETSVNRRRRSTFRTSPGRGIAISVRR